MPAQVAERLHADRPTISGIIDRLSKKGLIQIERNPADRRSQLLRLTREAKQLYPILEQDANNTISQALTGLSAEQIKQLTTSLVIVIQNLEQ